MSQLFDFPEICITEASAGSGKTYALARRYVQLLLKTSKDNPQGFKSILAITFTNKASVEMKTRVLYFLKKIALHKLTPKEEKDFLVPLNLSGEEAAKIAFSLMDSLIRHYHFFSIKTIDSFINTLLAGCAFKINLSARFKISRNSDDYLEQSLDQWITLAQDNAKVRQILDDFVHQYLFLENRSGWFPKDDLLQSLRMLFNEFNTYQKSFVIFPAESKDLFLGKKRFLEIVRDVHINSNPSMNKKFHDGLTKFLEENPVSFDLDDISRYFAYPEFPANKGVEISPELHKLWTQAHKRVDELCLAESYGVFNPYVMIFENIMEIFKNLSAQDDVLFLQELNKKAATLIEGGISVSELYYRMAVRFHHYLIDEFQDTSLSQLQNLKVMIEEAISVKGSLFTVGDKKQAIYSFRGGESRLFDELPLVFPNAPIRRDYLTQNFRSHKSIVEFNNIIFSQMNLEDFFTRRRDRANEKGKTDDEVYFSAQDIEGLQKTFEHSHQEIREDLSKGYVHIDRINGKRKQERQEQIKSRLFEIIADVRTRFALKDIAVLTRTNGQVEEVTQWLLAQGIHARSERSCNIKNHPLIIEAVDFLRFLNAPIENVHFARFLLGDIFPKVSGLSSEILREFLFKNRRQKEVLGENYLYKEFRSQYPELWNQYFEEFFSQAGVYPVYELAVSIYAKFQLQEFKDAQGFLMHFLELIKRQEEFSCDLEGFIEYFDQLENEERFVPMVAQDAITITTVHKAKGLQFAVVITPFLEMTVQTSKSSDRALSYVLDVSDDGLRMLRLKKTYGHFSEHLKKRYDEEYKNSLMVELNNVYVALTRAVSELYIMVPEKSGSSINPAIFLFPEELVSLGEKDFKTIPQKQLQNLPILETKLDPTWVPQFKEESLEDHVLQAELREHGVMMHFCLSQITRIEKNIDDVIAQAIELAKAQGFEVGNGRDRSLRDFLFREDVHRFFDVSKDVEVLCEQDIVNRYGDTRRIDRLLIFKDKVWIIDFKSSRTQRIEHEVQIKDYVSIVKELYPKHQVEGFLIYLS